jgi:hypothetical protein
MKYLIAPILGFLFVLSANAAPPRVVPVERDVLSLAKVLQARLPTLAEDGMCEVERQDNGWSFAIRVKSDRTGSQMLQVFVRASSDSRSELRVQGVRVESSLLTSRRVADPELSKEWTDRVLALVAEAN